MRRDGIQIVHAHDYKTDLLAVLLARAEGTVAMATAHGWTGHSPRDATFITRPTSGYCGGATAWWPCRRRSGPS